jgi:O-antigen/teichoic acid export membrane protein
MIPSSENPPAPPLPPPRRRVMLNVLFSVLLKLQGGLFSYASTFLLLRALKIEDYGLYSVLYIGTITNAGTLARLGLPNLLTRFIPEYFAQSNYRMIARLFRASTILQAVVAAIVVGVTFLIAPQIGVWIKYPDSATVIRIFTLGIVTYLLSENLRMLFGGLFMHRTIFWVNLVYNVLRLSAIFWVTRLREPFVPVVIAETALYGLLLIMYYVASHYQVQPRVAADVRPPEPIPWRRFTRYTVLSYINEIGVMLLSSATDLFLVSGFLGGPMVALYGLAGRIQILQMNVLPNRFLETVITPLFFSEYGASKENAQFGFTLLVKSSLLVTIPIALWTAMMARPLIVEFFDPRYSEAAPLLMVMALALILEVLRYPLGLMLQNAERNDLIIYCKVFAVIKIFVGLWLLPIYGALAMVWITTAAILAQNLLNYYWIVAKLGARVDYGGLLRMTINALVAATAFYPLRPFFTGLAGTILSILFFGALWLGISALHKTFRPEERAFINSKLPKPLWVF